MERDGGGQLAAVGIGEQIHQLRRRKLLKLVHIQHPRPPGFAHADHRPPVFEQGQQTEKTGEAAEGGLCRRDADDTVVRDQPVEVDLAYLPFVKIRVQHCPEVRLRDQLSQQKSQTGGLLEGLGSRGIVLIDEPAGNVYIFLPFGI